MSAQMNCSGHRKKFVVDMILNHVWEVQRVNLPIDLVILEKDSEIPTLISQLSYVDEQKAIEYVRIWGEKRMPITPLHAALSKEIANGSK